MLTPVQRLQYFAASLRGLNRPAVCPACSNKRSHVIDRKALITTLRECLECGLYFRHPSDSAIENERFYQDQYVEGDGITTFKPDPEELRALLDNGFAQYPAKHAGRIVELLSSLFGKLESIRLIDYGASWGYIAFQLHKAGVDVQGYEISRPRANYGRDALQIPIETDVDKLRSDNDVFFSSHVIEHVPNPTQLLQTAQRLVRPGGFVISLCPNGSPAFRDASPDGFHRAWGKVHPNLLNAKYFQQAAGDKPYFIASTPDGWQRIHDWDRHSKVIDRDLSGPEILMVWRPN